MLAGPTPPPIGLRVRTGDLDAHEASLLELAPGAEVSRGRAARAALLLRHAGDPRRLAPVSSGALVVQEEGSQAVAEAVGARAGERVLDACAGRGNKSLALADAVGPTGRVDAADLFDGKLARLRDEAARLGLSLGETFAVDWTVGAGDVPEGAYDRVLVDAPCSGTGTLRRRPEILLRRGSADLAALSATQRIILTRAARAARPGGVVVYATCSVLVEELEDVIGAVDGLRVREVRRLVPHVHGTDGYGIAVCERSLRVPGGRLDRAAVALAPDGVAQDLVRLVQHREDELDLRQQIGGRGGERPRGLERAPQLDVGPPQLVRRRGGGEAEQREIVGLLDEREPRRDPGAQRLLVERIDHARRALGAPLDGGHRREHRERGEREQHGRELLRPRELDRLRDRRAARPLERLDLARRQRALPQQLVARPLGEPRAPPAEARQGDGRRHRAPRDLDEHLGAGRAAEHAGLVPEPPGGLRLLLARAGRVDDAREEPLGVPAQDLPEAILREVPVRHERRARVATEGRQLAPEPARELGGEIAAGDEERDERLVLERRRRRQEISVAEHDAAQPLAVVEAEAHGLAQRDRAAELAERVALTEGAGGAARERPGLRGRARRSLRDDVLERGHRARVGRERARRLEEAVERRL
ncbi:MAG: RsmB/NOP family class I SAM-dependent RNA methyltransferase [Polyangiaceae bacterium]|nr:RsmB/NOP family class I SAM-dependent RNA methyltransferase [Polyangiaceae bacterium]